MPPSTNRRTRARRETELQDVSDPELPDSSPSRPARKKRRTQTTERPQMAPSNGGVVPAYEDQLPVAEEEVETSQDPVDTIIPYLSVCKDRVQVSIDHANSILERDYKNGVQAYAKVAGRDWTYYVKTLRVNIGRPPDGAARLGSEQPSQPSPGLGQQDENLIQIDLGPSKLVSRLHAEIFFDATGAACWHIIVNGRNGVKVNETVLKRGQQMKLSCGDILEIAGTQMIFITPDEQPQIHPNFLNRARLLAAEEEGALTSGLPHAHPESSYHGQPTSAPQQPPASRNAGSSQVPLAPAPPDFKRQSTPASSRGVDSDHKSKASPAYHRGMMMESTEEIDYSADSARDLKPPYSYATMIGQAILASEEEKLTLNSIYQWIMEKYAFYRYSQSGWQNSIRHNLSLNKSFQKIPRRTDEPGKGMKWQIVPEHREEFTKRGQRASGKGGNRGSSAPNSPAAKETASFTPANASTADHGRSLDEPREPAAGPSGRVKYSPRSTTPPLSSYPVAPKEAYTPDRGSRLPAIRRQDNGPRGGFDDSPVPVSREKTNPMVHPYGLSDAAAGSPPTLSSSAYMDESQPMITPAPRRQHPRLAPPSTAQVPSTYMPTSSPAPFWKYVDLGSTPAKPMPDLSPTKSVGPTVPQSSSPPPAIDRDDVASPSNVGRRFSIDRSAAADKDKRSENGAAAAASGSQREGPENEPEEEMQGFDLARGFQPIGSFHKNMTNGVGGA
ncbi:hypothetical protein L228DRAFT_218540 [Xylona heveae TC161]|uniref:Forkhead transcription factor Fkh1/2 n=1 Tax=Xylona heveae (strain CBS 132557 / TC161) TaxID=1328760 RepID=A0A165HZW9_XYLHT|nr:hypothetical protein L228DRAFT_218540 [Xylona heveae TC161]KZF24155.1 hypothetical protein L228DRAFT_218540 [Xylona heveae TC161]